ncbi:hypothetical protein GCM10023093_02820 [Nemorincola caseinilytica]|uniref:Uncharacterized protein n=1 Tax=Nemorincola caseinilytica TaxID=2054315 RepID=A0ABP8N2U8_9BACT
MKDPELLSLEKRIRNLLSYILATNNLYVGSEKEAKYLLDGHATELIQKIKLPLIYDKNASLEIYGMIAANQSNGRYVWIYLYYWNKIWKCNNLESAFEFINKYREYYKLHEEKELYLRKAESKRKLLEVTKN